jgi:hypothetical protein
MCGKPDIRLGLGFLLITLFCMQKNAQTRCIFKNSYDKNVKVIINIMCRKIGFMIRTRILIDNPLLYAANCTNQVYL